MRTTKWTGLLFAAFLVLSCDTKKIGKCTSQADCPEEGAYCDNETALCVLNCETRECDPGHFCDLSTKQCVTECPYVCPTPPENATITCEDPCVGFTCNTGFHVCSGVSCASDTDATLCGADCRPCPAPDNGTATCEIGTCSYKCNTGYFDDNQGHCEFGTRYVPDTTPNPDEPMIIDNVTKLIWQGCAAGLTGVDCTKDKDGKPNGTATTMNWFAAADEDDISVDSTDGDYCSTLIWGGKDDWRLPKEETQNGGIADELESILLAKYPNCPATGPCIDSRAFPNTPAYYFWSSSSYANLLNYAWIVYFGYGNVYYLDKSNTFYVRCVRSGP